MLRCFLEMKITVIKSIFLSALSLFLIPLALYALGPHEILLLVNEKSPDSIEIAEEFARLRYVPDRNLVRLSVPLNKPGKAPEISPEQFTRLIWEPATRAIRDRGIDKQILAWVYSSGFPTTIQTKTPVSIQGLTFLRNRQPSFEEVNNAKYTSPLFCGPIVAKKRYRFMRPKVLMWLPNGCEMRCHYLA